MKLPLPDLALLTWQPGVRGAMSSGRQMEAGVSGGADSAGAGSAAADGLALHGDMAVTLWSLRERIQTSMSGYEDRLPPTLLGGGGVICRHAAPSDSRSHDHSRLEQGEGLHMPGTLTPPPLHSPSQSPWRALAVRL